MRERKPRACSQGRRRFGEVYVSPSNFVSLKVSGHGSRNAVIVLGSEKYPTSHVQIENGIRDRFDQILFFLFTGTRKGQ